jgi:hypothetical protein
MRKTVTTLVCAALTAFLPVRLHAAAPGLAVQPGPNMKLNRMGHYYATLPGGRVALFGGHGTSFVSLSSAEIFSPTADSFTLYTMAYVHDAPAFARLADGRYLLAGGAADLGVAPGYAAAEIFDPAANSFSAITAQMNYGRMTSGAATLAGGKVLIVGGWYDNASAANAETFDPQNGAFTAAGQLNAPRAWPLVVPADDGTAVVFGGVGIYGSAIRQLIEVYDPAHDGFTVADSGLFDADTGWNGGTLVSYNRTLDQQKLKDGRYLFFAVKGTAYQLFTFDPSSKAFEKAGAPIIDTTLSLTAPVVDSARGRAYVIGERWGDGGVQTAPIQICCYVVNTLTWAVKAPTDRDTLPPSYFLSGAGFSMMNDGRILMTGGHSEIGYNTNFSPNDSSRILVPDTSMPSGIRRGPAAAGDSKPYRVRPVAGGIRFHSSIRENLVISLVSSSGRTAAPLFRGIVEPGISYDFSLGGKRLAVGAYYCSIKSATRTVTVRVVLAK